MDDLFGMEKLVRGRLIRQHLKKAESRKQNQANYEPGRWLESSYEPICKCFEQQVGSFSMKSRVLYQLEGKIFEVHFGGFISNSKTDLLLLCYYFHGIGLVLSILAEGCNNMDSNH